MKVLMLARCTLCAQAQPAIQPDFKPDKVSGKWFGLAVVARSPQVRSTYWSVFTSDFTFTADGKLNVETTIPRNGSCEKETKTYTKTKIPGRYIIKDKGIQSVLAVLDLDLSDLAVVMAQFIYGQDPSDSVLYLLGRTLIWPAETYELFKELAEDFRMDVTSASLLTGLCMT